MKALKNLTIRQVYLQPGELFIDDQPALVQTILGSCVSVTMFCPRGGFGGICHAQLPDGKTDEPGRYVNGAVKLMLEQMLQLGARQEWLEVKLFGGGKVLGEPAGHRLSIGEQNVAQAKSLLQRLNLQVIADDTGGLRGRRLFFNSGTGEVFVRKVRISSAVMAASTRSCAA